MMCINKLVVNLFRRNEFVWIVGSLTIHNMPIKMLVTSNTIHDHIQSFSFPNRSQERITNIPSCRFHTIIAIEDVLNARHADIQFVDVCFSTVLITAFDETF